MGLIFEINTHIIFALGFGFWMSAKFSENAGQGSDVGLKKDLEFED